MIGLSLSLWVPKGTVGSSEPPELPVPPTARWHASYSPTQTSNGRVTTAADLMNTANGHDAGSGAGPKHMTDALGRPFWRFEGSEWLAVDSALVTSNREVTVFAVARILRTSSRGVIFSPGRNGSASNTGGYLETRSYAGSAPFLSAVGRLAYQGNPTPEHFVPGAQLQVLGIVSSGSGIRYHLNEHRADGLGSSVNYTGLAGAEIGRFAFNGSSYAMCDLYELMVFDRVLTTEESDAIAMHLQSTWAIPAVDSQVVFEGDSITQGTGDVTAGLSCAAIASAPGANLLPATYRVINIGTSGAQISQLLSRRDSAASWCDQRLPGRNLMAFELGRNDMFGGGRTAAEHHANVISYLNSAPDGILQNGWDVRQLVNISTSDTVAGTGGPIGAYRALITDDSTYLTALNAHAEGAFAGHFSTVDTHLIEDGGKQVFFSANDAADITYFAGDSTHPGPLGAQLRITGGDTPDRSPLASV